MTTNQVSKKYNNNEINILVGQPNIFFNHELISKYRFSFAFGNMFIVVSHMRMKNCLRLNLPRVKALKRIKDSDIENSSKNTVYNTLQRCKKSLDLTQGGR